MPRRKVLYASLLPERPEMNILYVNSLEANNKELARQLASANVLIAEQNKLGKERQEWALHTNEVIRSLNQQLAAEIMRFEIALRIKTEEHKCYSEDLMKLRESEQSGWKEAAIAWEVCGSIHEKFAKGKDALYSTRHADFEKHAEDARRKLTPNAELCINHDA